MHLTLPAQDFRGLIFHLSAWGKQQPLGDDIGLSLVGDRVGRGAKGEMENISTCQGWNQGTESSRAPEWGVKAVPCRELGFLQDPMHFKFSEP